MNWTAIGGDPVPGDVDAVLRVASTLGQICDQAEAVHSRLRTLDGSAGPQIWRGDAANAFRDLLTKAGPDLAKLAGSHLTAEDSLRRYATVLGQAQDQARRAESDGEVAVSDRTSADARRRQAGAEAASQESTARTAGLRILQAQAQAAAAPWDPAYQASMRHYEQQTGVLRGNAQARAAGERQAEVAAGAAVDAADARLAAARKLAHQAAMLRDDAARTATRELDAAGAQGISHENVFQRAWHEVSGELRDITASPEFAHWMNVISDVGEVLGDIGTVLAFVPGMQGIAAGFMVAGAAFKGVAFLGTALAALYGHASGAQVAGRGLDFGLSFLGATKALKVAKLGKAGPVTTLAGEIKRAKWYDNGRKATGVFREVKGAPKWSVKTTERLGKAHVDPKLAFQVKTLYGAVNLGYRAGKVGHDIGSDAAQLVQDVQHPGDPAPQHLAPQEAPKAAKTIAGMGVDQLAKSTKHDGVPVIVIKKIVEFGAGKGMEVVTR